jgi:hypothetical protein
MRAGESGGNEMSVQDIDIDYLRDVFSQKVCFWPIRMAEQTLALFEHD